jgi:hypothetical protein
MLGLPDRCEKDDCTLKVFLNVYDAKEFTDIAGEMHRTGKGRLKSPFPGKEDILAEYGLSQEELWAFRACM